MNFGGGNKVNLLTQPAHEKLQGYYNEEYAAMLPSFTTPLTQF